jgi:molybdopterin-dependent oxidoreductase alpha subunit
MKTTTDPIKIEPQATAAGGFKAIYHSIDHIIREVGIVDGTKALLKLNQFNGFDCPGCAWPDPDEHRSAFEFCENGAKAVAEEATTALCDPEFFRRHSVSEMQGWTDYEIGKSGRISEPMILHQGSEHYEPISWANAFSFIGDALRNLSSPDQAIFYTSGRTSNEAAFLYQLMVRMYGTNNLPDCSNMCHESSGVALTETLGIGKGSVKLEDFPQAEVIMVIGQNPGTNHPRMLTSLQEAKKRGAIIISVNPIAEAGLISFSHPQKPSDLLAGPTQLTDIWLQVRINQDVALLKAINKLLIERERRAPGTVIDRDFIDKYTAGLDTFLADLEKHSVDTLINQSGVEFSRVLEVVEILATRNRIIVCWAMGLTQHLNAVDNIREVVNLLLLKGSVGKPGAGTCPVRGHSNVQGDRTMGIYEKPSKDFLTSLQKVFGFAPPQHNGYDTVEAIQAMREGKAKVFIGMGGNFVSAAPDTQVTIEALRTCDLTVQISTKLNRSHLTPGKTALILPCLGRTEKDIQESGIQFVTVENSAGVVHQSKGEKLPVSKQLLSEPKIVAELAKATLSPSGSRVLNWDELAGDYNKIRDLIEQTIPGFENYNQRVRKPGGFYLPNGIRERKFRTITSKANFSVNELAVHNLHDDQFLMMTIRSHDQYNTTIYGLHDRYRGIHNGRRVVFMNDQDIQRLKLSQGEHVDILSHYEGIERTAQNFVVVPYNIPVQNIATYFPEANALVPFNSFARKSQTPVSKSVVVSIRRHLRS